MCFRVNTELETKPATAKGLKYNLLYTLADYVALINEARDLRY